MQTSSSPPDPLRPPLSLIEGKRFIIFRSAPMADIKRLLATVAPTNFATAEKKIVAQQNLPPSALQELFGDATIEPVPPGPFQLIRALLFLWYPLFTFRPDVIIIPCNNALRQGYAKMELFAILLCAKNALSLTPDGARHAITVTSLIDRLRQKVRLRLAAPRIGDPVLWLRVALYAISAPVTNAYRLAQALWSCRRLIGAGGQDHIHFNVAAGINHFAYWTEALNISRYGRMGVSPHIGNGDYPMRRWFHLTLTSLYPYWKNPTATLLFGMFGWLLSHLLWLTVAQPDSLLLVMLLALLSSHFYHNLFEAQTYNALGWMLVPAALFATQSEGGFFAASLWLAASQFSFTIGFVSLFLIGSLALAAGALDPLWIIAPTALNLARYCAPLISSGDLLRSFGVIASGIGLSDKNVKYRWKQKAAFSYDRLVYLFLVGQFLVTISVVTGAIPPLLATGLALYFVNAHISRFSDQQNMYMLLLSLTTLQIIQTPTLPALLSYWLAISPLPLALGWLGSHQFFDILPPRAPVPIKRITNGMRTFLSPLPAGSKILAPHNDPQGAYENIFDGYRIALELPLYVASEKKIHLTPDWWAIFDGNKPGSPDHFWGRDPQSVAKNMRSLGAEFALLYQTGSAPLDSAWEKNGFESLGHFDWADYADDLGGEFPFDGPPLNWWIVRKSNLGDGEKDHARDEPEGFSSTG